MILHNDDGKFGCFWKNKIDFPYIQASYATQQDIQIMRFADYFGRAFASVSAAQFPWVKMFKECTVAKLVDVSCKHETCMRLLFSGPHLFLHT